MYVPARRNRTNQRNLVLRPSQRYYIEPAQIENRIDHLGFLGEPLADQLKQSWNTQKDKQKIFSILRQQPAFPLDATVTTALDAIFSSAPDELWLAKTLAQRGPEPLWLADEIKQRVQKVKSLGTEPGNYQATLKDPHPGPRLTGSLVKCFDSLKSTQLPLAFFFPGRSERRALVIAGVHGNEKRGVEVVKNLRTLLATRTAAGNKPFFSTILVPVVIPRTLATSDRNVPGGLGISTTGALKCRAVEPNRNFPLPGEDLTTARARGAAGPDVAELMFRPPTGSLRAPKDAGTDSSLWVTSIRMLPETRILISLIERFQPERLASVHDHSLKQACHPCSSGKVSKCGGEGPGIFMDPRGIDPATNQVKSQSVINADDQLARRMAEGALARLPCSVTLLKSAFPPFAGNQAFFPPTVRYFSPQRVEGNSLGDWAPVPAGSRPGIATMTIEVPKYLAAHATQERLVKDLHRDLLQEIFLEP